MPKIVISGGGTGGHIFPAIAIADGLRARLPDADILFVGAKGRMEMQRVPQAGYAIKGLYISGLQRKLNWKNLLFPFKVLYALWQAWHLLRQFKPDVVIGVGGYASGPTLQAAILLKIPSLIQEQNSYPGITNRMLGRKADCICVAYEHMEKWFPKAKTIRTGNPLRETAVKIQGKKQAALKFFGLSPAKPVVLIVGGSQGALAINRAIAGGLDKIAEQDLQLIWQTGTNYLAAARKRIGQLDDKTGIEAWGFIKRMDMAYAAADIIVSRAGAMAISEMAVVGKPVIFVPLPTAAEDHQTKNAKRLVARKAAMIVENKDANAILVPSLIGLAKNPEKRQQMANQIKKFALPDAGERIVDEILKLIPSQA